MKVLCTGSQGYIGLNLVPYLINRKHHVRCYDKIFNQDILDKEQLAESMRGCDIVYNLAAIPGIRNCEENKQLAHDINVVGANNVVETATNYGVKPVLFSSFAVKGDSYYGKTKLEMEKQNKDKAVILRMSNVFGGIDYQKMKANNFLSRIAVDDPIQVYDKTQTRDFVHVNSVLDWCLRAVDLPFGVYDVCSGREVDIETIALIVGMVRDVEVKYGK